MGTKEPKSEVAVTLLLVTAVSGAETAGAETVTGVEGAGAGVAGWCVAVMVRWCNFSRGEATNRRSCRALRQAQDKLWPEKPKSRYGCARVTDSLDTNGEGARRPPTIRTSC